MARKNTGAQWLLLLFLGGLLSPLVHALLVTRIDDVWMLELACRYPAVTFYAASGSLLARARDGQLYAANGALEARITACDRVQDRSGVLLARRSGDGCYSLASGALLGRFEPDGRVLTANGSLALRLRDGAVYLPSGVLLAKFRVE